MSVKIEPFVVTNTYTYTNALINVTTVRLGESADITVELFDKVGGQRDIRNLVLSQPEYSQWGSDDQFIVNWSLAQIGAVPSQ
jgi:hypothetical protein